MTDLPNLLEGIPLFRDLEPAHLDRIAGCMRRVSVEEGGELTRVGEPGDALFLILSGSVQVLYPGHRSEFEMARLGPGDHIGEMSLLDHQPRSATVRALDEVEVAALDRDAFRTLGAETPGLAMRMLETLAVRMRGADEHISMLSDMALRDMLTGLLNRRAFHDRMKQEADRARRYKTEFSLLLFDLDHFKAVNDTLGHDVGDDVLRWVGRILSEHTRASDTPFRIGGEEFAVICPNTGAEVVGVAAERIVGLPRRFPPPVDELEVTMSAGYASCPGHGSSFESLYRAADQALLRAKDSGRNQVGEPERGPAR